MLFSEIHGAYFDAVSSILSAAVDGRLTQQKLLQIVQEKGFTESTLTIPQKLQSGDWPCCWTVMARPCDTNQRCL